jgi:hypothetical protein
MLRAQARTQPVLGADHPQTLSSRNNLANAYRLAGQLDEEAAKSTHGRKKRWFSSDRG